MNLTYRLIILQLILMSGGSVAMKLVTMDCDALAFFAIMPFSIMSYFLHDMWYEER